MKLCKCICWLTIKKITVFLWYGQMRARVAVCVFFLIIWNYLPLSSLAVSTYRAVLVLRLFNNSLWPQILYFKMTILQVRQKTSSGVIKRHTCITDMDRQRKLSEIRSHNSGKPLYKYKANSYTNLLTTTWDINSGQAGIPLQLQNRCFI